MVERDAKGARGGLWGRGGGAVLEGEPGRLTGVQLELWDVRTELEARG